MSDSLGDRMKRNYEDRARHYLIRRMPVVVRLDGKAFHTLTRGCTKPFDAAFADAMLDASLAVFDEAQGCKAAYIQSDEASFLLSDFDTLQTDAWFDNNKSKIESIAASCMTAHFSASLGRIGLFDARAFNLPREEVANYFLWRIKDWERNSVAMYAQSCFSPKQLHGKGRADQHEMLHSVGRNWATDIPERFRNGTWLVRVDGRVVTKMDILPVYASVAEVVDRVLAERASISRGDEVSEKTA